MTKQLGGPSGWTTPVSIQNIGSVNTLVTLELFRFADGAAVATLMSPDLRPGQSWLFDPLAYANLPYDTQFALVLRPASAPVAAVVLESAARSAMAYSGSATGASSLYLPNITRRLGGAGGWDTPFIVQNLGGVATTVTVSFYGFASGALERRLDGITIAPGRSQAFVPWTIEGLRDDAQYSVVIDGPSGSQLHAIVNEHSGDQAMSYAAQQRGAQNLVLPNIMKYVGPESWYSPFIVQNVGTATASFALAFYPVGVPQMAASTGYISLAPGRAAPVDVRFLPANLAAGRYSVFIAGTAGAQLVAIVNQHANGMAMSYEGFGEADRVAAMPHVTKNSGPVHLSSQIIAANMGPTSDVVITVFDTNGVVAARRTFLGVQTGISLLYDLALDAGLPDGTYSALAQADQKIVAVVNEVGSGSGDLALSYGSTPASAAANGATPSPTPTIAPTAPPTPAPVAVPTPSSVPLATPVAVAAGARRYTMGMVLVVPNGTTASQVTALTTLTNGIGRMLPDHWSAATSGLSTMATSADTYVLVDTDGTLLGPAALDTTLAAGKFYRSNADVYDFLTFFPFTERGEYRHEIRQQSEPGTYGVAPNYLPPGVSQVKGYNVIAISPSFYLSAVPRGYMQVMLHETHHQWCCFVNTPAGYGLDPIALTPIEAGRVHWSAWLFIPPSPKYPIVGGDASGWGWIDNRDGSYTIDCSQPDPGIPGNYAYPKLGLWMMGLIGAGQVPPIELLTGSGDPRPSQSSPYCGTYRVSKVTIPAQALLDANPYLRR